MELAKVPQDKVIMQHNMITSGRYDFTACQLDILFLLLSTLDKGDAPNKEYDLYVNDIEVFTGRKWNYQQLIQATEDMGSRMFVIETNETFEQLWLFTRFKYMKGKGYFTVTLSDGVRPYLFELKDNFTYMQLKAVLSCSSKFAKRLYALACQWRSAGSKEMTISELKEMLYLKDPKGKEKEQFERISEFQSKVLDLAKRQINGHTDIKFDYKLRKRGRTYHYIKILINHHDMQQLQIDFQESPTVLKNLKAITGMGVHEDAARIIAKSHFKEFATLHDQIHDQARKQGKYIEDPAAYIVDHFQRKGILKVSLLQKEYTEGERGGAKLGRQVDLEEAIKTAKIK